MPVKIEVLDESGPRGICSGNHGGNSSCDDATRLMQALGLDSHLENLLPDSGIQPIDQVKRQGRERQRASRSTAKKPAATWSWDQDETP